MPNPPLTGSSWRTEEFDVASYLETIGFAHVAGGGTASFDLLADLHEAHVRSLPFGNIDVLLGQHPGVAPSDVQDQLIRRGRGGYCFEHSQLFAAAVEHLGFEPRRVLGRVRGLDAPRTHMSVVVPLDGGNWLCDPGFGFSITHPIELRDGATQGEGERQFRIEHLHDDGGDLWALTRAGALEHVHDDRTVHPVDVTLGHLATSQWPLSKFRHHLMVMRHTGEGHVTLTEFTRTERVPGRPTQQSELTVAEVVDSVRELGIRLGREDIARLTRRVEEIRT